MKFHEILFLLATFALLSGCFNHEFVFEGDTNDLIELSNVTNFKYGETIYSVFRRKAPDFSYGYWLIAITDAHNARTEKELYIRDRAHYLALKNRFVRLTTAQNEYGDAIKETPHHAEIQETVKALEAAFSRGSIDETTLVGHIKDAPPRKKRKNNWPTLTVFFTDAIAHFKLPKFNEVELRDHNYFLKFIREHTQQFVATANKMLIDGNTTTQLRMPEERDKPLIAQHAAEIALHQQHKPMLFIIENVALNKKAIFMALEQSTDKMPGFLLLQSVMKPQKLQERGLQALLSAMVENGKAIANIQKECNLEKITEVLVLNVSGESKVLYHLVSHDKHTQHVTYIKITETKTEFALFEPLTSYEVTVNQLGTIEAQDGKYEALDHTYKIENYKALVLVNALVQNPTFLQKIKPGEFATNIEEIIIQQNDGEYIFVFKNTSQLLFKITADGNIEEINR